MGRIAVVFPLTPGAGEKARALIAHGPPFDPDEAGLESYFVFITELEAVFVFEADARGAVERLVADPGRWTAVVGWGELAAGHPRVAEDAYSWVRPTSPENVSYESTPGPGDSDGGDLYAP